MSDLHAKKSKHVLMNIALNRSILVIYNPAWLFKLYALLFVLRAQTNNNSNNNNNRHRSLTNAIKENCTVPIARCCQLLQQPARYRESATKAAASWSSSVVCSGTNSCIVFKVVRCIRDQQTSDMIARVIARLDPHGMYRPILNR